MGGTPALGGFQRANSQGLTVMLTGAAADVQ
jgi:hypothetical protein